MTLSRTSRAPRLLAGLATAAVVSSTLALVAPAHASTPWQLGFEHTYATALSADGSHVYAVGSTTPEEGPDVYTFDSVNTATGAVIEQTLDFGEQDHEADAFSQEDAFAIATDGTLFVAGYHASPSDFGTDYSGILWTFAPQGDGSAITTTLVDDFSEISALGLHDNTLVLGGTDVERAPVIQAGPASGYAGGEAEYATYGISDSADTSIDAIAVAGDAADDDLAIWVTGRTYDQKEGQEESTTSNVLWRATSPDQVVAFPLADEALSITATADRAYVGEASWSDKGIDSTRIQAFPTAEGAVTAIDVQGNVPESLSISPAGDKVIGVGYGTTFAVDVAVPTKPVINNYVDDGTIDAVAFSATNAYAVVDVSTYDQATETYSSTKKVEAMTTLPWNAPPASEEPGTGSGTPQSQPQQQSHAPAVKLTPAQQKVADAQAKVTQTNAAIVKAKAAVAAAKKAHNKAAAKKAAKQIAKLKKTLKKQKAAVAKAKAAAKKAAKKATKKSSKKKH